MKRLAITIAGAVSLGSFEAGALYELVTAIARHNARTQADERCVIDVLTGASAGGMTACIAAQKLLYEADALEGAATNALYRPWVREVSLSALLELARDEDPARSIFSSDLIETIAARHMTARYQSPVVRAASRHPAAGERLLLGLAMSNLSGVDYGLETQTGEAFTYTCFEDEFVVELGEHTDCLQTWEPIRAAAVACGAFPFAFRIKDLVRSTGAYLQRGAQALPPTNGRFAYTDGGLFHNEPLALAKNLVDRLDPQHLNHDSRAYVFIAPNLRESVMDKGNFAGASATAIQTARRLVTAIFNQARYQDWANVEQINRRIEAFNSQAIKLLQQARPDVVQQLASLASLVIATEAGGEPLEQRQARLAAQFATALSEARTRTPADAPPDEQTYARALAVLEQAAGVQCYDEMRVFPITQPDGKLAGSCLFGFGGFFDLRYRQHDYDRGRLATHDLLARHASQIGIEYDADRHDLPTPDPAFDAVVVSDLSTGARRQLKTQLQLRAHVTMRSLGLSVVEREAIDLALLSPRLNQLLAL